MFIPFILQDFCLFVNVITEQSIHLMLWSLNIISFSVSTPNTTENRLTILFGLTLCMLLLNIQFVRISNLWLVTSVFFFIRYVAILFLPVIVEPSSPEASPAISVDVFGRYHGSCLYFDVIRLQWISKCLSSNWNFFILIASSFVIFVPWKLFQI